MPLFINDKTCTVLFDPKGLFIATAIEAFIFAVILTWVFCRYIYIMKGSIKFVLVLYGFVLFLRPIAIVIWLGTYYDSWNVF